jgi:hypothetical protein
MSSDERTRRWRELVDEHRRALEEFLATSEALPDATWHAPRANGKWSPAQIAEHLRLTCDTVQAEVERRGGFRVRTSWLRQRLLRLLVLRRMLRTRRFPQGAPAVREIRPDAAARYEQRQTLDGLRRHADSLVAALSGVDPATYTGVTHQFFGTLAPLQGLELITLHVRHHHAQVLEAARPAAAMDVAAATPRPA